MTRKCWILMRIVFFKEEIMRSDRFNAVDLGGWECCILPFNPLLELASLFF